MTGSAAPPQVRLGEIALLFLKLGTVAFGGPAAHVAMMEDEVVRRRGWLDRQEFLDYLGATNLIPGPNSTEMAIHIGLRKAGWPGLVVAGSCFILPATFIVTAIAWIYRRFGTLPAAAGVLHGVKPVVIAVVLQALIGLGRTAIKSRSLAVIAALAAIATALGLNELLVLAGAGVAVVLLRVPERLRDRQWSGILGPVIGAAIATPSIGLAPLFLVFLKIGSVLFGSGYVLLAFLRADLVQRLHWLTERQLLDAVAVGQVTPGPVFTTATFVGYIVAGNQGALVATLGIFLPAFVFVAISGVVVPKLRQSPTAAAGLDGVNVASLALMAVVAWQLSRAAVVDWSTLGIGAASAILLFRFRVNSAWLVLGGAVVGALLSR